MAKQHNPIQLTGQLGGISFYEMKGKYYARKKTAHNITTDPRFTRTHLNSLDFGTAHRASRLLRDALGSTIKAFSDTYIASRMTGRFVSVVRADSTHALGKRKVRNVNLALLKGFEFNKHQAFKASGISTSAVSIDRAAGVVKISLAIDSTTRVDTQLLAGIACVNFDKGTYTRHSATATLTQIENKELILRAPFDADPNSVVIVTLGSPYFCAMSVVAVYPPSASSRIGNSVKQSSRIPHLHNRSACIIFAPWTYCTFPRAREGTMTQSRKLMAATSHAGNVICVR